MIQMKTTKQVFQLGFLCLALSCPSFAQDLDRTGTQWYPFIEWTLQNTSYENNPYDLRAEVTFTHPSGETRETEMFYAENDRWKFRFTGTQVGEWSFTTQSQDSDLDGLTGTVTVEPNPNPQAHGFVKKFEEKWGWMGTEEAFVPQFAMYDDPSHYRDNPEKIEADIEMFFNQHGLNGFHTQVYCRWFDINQTKYDNIRDRDPNPDPRTFEALELLITKTHAAGGLVHIWAWGDEQRHMTPIKWGKNGAVDQRLQRYIAARLGPVPGWTMGYGFDLFEWVKEEDLREWHSYMHEHFGWSHFLGGRPGGPRSGLNHKRYQIYEGLDYSSYEHHQPTYEVYVAALEARPGKPVFSEDRFRLRDPSPYPDKDYTEVLTRRGLWHSTMAGGVANIWGNLIHESAGGGSGPYEHHEWIKTNSRFFENRFLKNMVRDNSITDGVALKTPNNKLFVFYKEDTEAIEMNLSSMPNSAKAVAVDTKKPYKEIDLGTLDSKPQTWQAPYQSDWAVAVGDFSTAHNNVKKWRKMR